MNSEKTVPVEESTSDATTSAVPAAGAGGVSEGLLQSPPRPSLFQEGESVIASHSDRHYLAKVEKVEFNEDWSYFIHYKGWSKSWDEWVGVDRLLKQTEENLQKVSYDRKQTTDKHAKTGCTTGTKLGTSSDTSGKMQKNHSSLMYRKRKREHIMVKGKDSEPVEKLVTIPIPPTLRKQLLDDSEFINHMGKLVRLPRSPNVDDIIQKYREYRGKKEDMTSASVEEVLSGICLYFNKALPVILLYNKEHEQYQEAIAENVLPSSLYGAEHLLRLFVRLPALLYELNIEQETLRELQQNIHDFLKRSRLAVDIHHCHAPMPMRYMSPTRQLSSCPSATVFGAISQVLAEEPKCVFPFHLCI